MKIYLDTNVFYNAYSPVEESKISDWLISQLDANLIAVTSEWTIIEMFRAFKKQVNLKTIEEEDATIALTYFLSEFGDLERSGLLLTVPVSRKSIIGGKRFIFEKNLYASDALHLFQAIDERVSGFVTFDKTFQSRIQEVKLLNPRADDFKTDILKLKSFSPKSE